MKLTILHKLKNKLILIFLIISLVVNTFFICFYFLNFKELKTNQFEKALVVEVIDGDTIILEDGRHIRYLGIDTPELNESWGIEATNRNKELVEGKVVELQKGDRDIDEYNRYLRYVYVDGVFVNAELISEGFAESFIFDPLDKYSQVLVQLEQYAKLKKVGIWK